MSLAVPEMSDSDEDTPIFGKTQFSLARFLFARAQMLSVDAIRNDNEAVFRYAKFTGLDRHWSRHADNSGCMLQSVNALPAL